MILKPRISGGIAYKRRWEFGAAILAIFIGMLLFFITFLIPNYSTNFIYEYLEETPFFLLKGIFTSISDTSIENPFYPLTIFFISFISFPSCLAWLFPAMLIGYYRTKQYYNLEIKNNGWKVFWHGTFFIEIVFLLLAVGAIIIFLFQFIPGVTLNDVLFSYLASAILKIMLFFISPFFWIGLLIAGIGGLIGRKMAMDKLSPIEIVIEEVEIEDLLEWEEKVIDEVITKEDDKAEMTWPEEALLITAEDSNLDVSQLKQRIRTSTEKSMKLCPKCGNNLLKKAKFCNKCGKKL